MTGTVFSIYCFTLQMATKKQSWARLQPKSVSLGVPHGWQRAKHLICLRPIAYQGTLAGSWI